MFNRKPLQFNRLKIAVLSVLTLFAGTSCTAHPAPKTTFSANYQYQKDSVMRKAVSDSIYDIISKAKKIKVEEVTMANVSTNKKSTVKVNRKDRSVLLFILSSPKNYCGDVDTYASFIPCFKVTYTYKKKKCIMYFDFGLKKWRICNANGIIIKQYDLPSDDMLRMANTLFPDNELYKKLINTDKR